MFISIDTNTKQRSKHDKIVSLKKKLPELDPDPDLVEKFPDPAKRSGSATLDLTY